MPLDHFRNLQNDIFWPFEYPEEWIRAGRAWNESYVVKASLQCNATFQIRLFNSHLSIHHAGVVGHRLPLWRVNPGGSLWIEKVS